MASFIELYERGRFLGTFDLPAYLHGEHGANFRLLYAVRGGGNGIVFAAEPQGPLRNEIELCAVKLLRQQDDTRLDRFENEIRIIRLLSHARIAQFFDSGTIQVEDGYRVPWMAMELGERNLRQHVERNGPLNPDTIRSVGKQMCDALEQLHQKQIIHRDVKPDNFVWDGEDESSVIMIDFGIAKLVGEDVSGRPMDQFTQQEEFVGPVFFASPELIAYASDKTQAVDMRSDLFQLGKVLWFLATGKISAGIPSGRDCPFKGALHDIVIQLLQDYPDDRPSTCHDVRNLLDALI